MAPDPILKIVVPAWADRKSVLVGLKSGIAIGAALQASFLAASGSVVQGSMPWISDGMLTFTAPCCGTVRKFDVAKIPTKDLFCPCENMVVEWVVGEGFDG